eukprot:Platyproteum_vivax@DN7632_c2_g1_i2.p1
MQSQKNEFWHDLRNMTGAYVAFFEEPRAQFGRAVIGGPIEKVSIARQVIEEKLTSLGLHLANESTNMEIPDIHAGKIIGRGGALLKNMRLLSGAQIDISRGTLETKQRSMKVVGFSHQVAFVNDIVRQKLLWCMSYFVASKMEND